jgi:hypothetical protein
MQGAARMIVVAPRDTGKREDRWPRASPDNQSGTTSLPVRRDTARAPRDDASNEVSSDDGEPAGDREAPGRGGREPPSRGRSAQSVASAVETTPSPGCRRRTQRNSQPAANAYAPNQ